MQLPLDIVKLGFPVGWGVDIKDVPAKGATVYGLATAASAASKDKGQVRRQIRQQLSVLIASDPAHAKGTAEMFRRGGPNVDRRMLIEALAASDSPAAKAEMAEIVDDASLDGELGADVATGTTFMPRPGRDLGCHQRVREVGRSPDGVVPIDCRQGIRVTRLYRFDCAEMEHPEGMREGRLIEEGWRQGANSAGSARAEASGPSTTSQEVRCILRFRRFGSWFRRC